jgi:hypothetical protein
MATWREVSESAPTFASTVQALFDAHQYKTLATIRRDGSPRISGIEAFFVAGDLWFGTHAGSRKERDLRCDPSRVAHSGDDVGGEDRLPGRAVDTTRVPIASSECPIGGVTSD